MGMGCMEEVREGEGAHSTVYCTVNKAPSLCKKASLRNVHDVHEVIRTIGWTSALTWLLRILSLHRTCAPSPPLEIVTFVSSGSVDK